MTSIIPAWEWPDNDEFTVLDGVDAPTYVFGPRPVTASGGEFANPWHDEVGKFAPKGTGTKFDGEQAAFEVINGREISVAASDLDEVVLEFADSDGPVDLTLVTVHDSDTMFSAMRKTGILREDMPQIPKTHINEFQDRLREMGVEMRLGEVDPRTLRATQAELDGRKVGQILRRIRNNDFNYQSEPLWVSNDGHVLDGHHRWAATAAESADCDGCVKMPIFHVDLPMSKLLKVANDFVDEKGIKRQGINEPERDRSRDRVAAAMQNGGVEYVTIATDTDDGITDEDIAPLPHDADGSAFADENTERADAIDKLNAAFDRSRLRWGLLYIPNSIGEYATLTTFRGNPWHDAIGRFAPKGTGRRFDETAATNAYDAALAARTSNIAALQDAYVLFYSDHGTRERSVTLAEAIDQYTQYGSTPMNGHLRKHGLDEIPSDEHRDALIDAVVLDEAMLRGGFTFDDDTVLLRGVRNTSANKLQPGVSFTDDGFISGTASERQADLAAGRDGTIIELTVPAGTRGLASEHTEEQEIILPRGGTFTVTEIAERGGRRVARVEAEFPDSPPPVSDEIPTIQEMLDRVGAQRTERDRLERERQERGLVAAGPDSEAALERILWDMGEDDMSADAEMARRKRRRWTLEPEPEAEFANPWHDEEGKFAPKGTGKQAGGPGAPPAEGDTFGETNSLGRDIPLPTRAQLLNAHDPIPETPEMESTLLEHMDENGNLTPERQAIHDKLIADMLDGIVPGNPKRALVMGGGAAAGKSSAIEHGFVDQPEGAVIINPDDFKVKIPETAGPASDGRQGDGAADKLGSAWASYAHEESSYLGKRLHAASTELGANIVLDKVNANGAKAVAEIKALREQGYEVDVAYVTTDIDAAVQRAVDRGAKIGREVPQSVLKHGHEGANQAFLQVAAEAGVPTTLVTTRSAQSDGSIPPPTLTASTDGGGTLVVHDRQAFDEYLARIPSTSLPESLRVVYDEDLVKQAARVRPQWTVFADEGVAPAAYNDSVTNDGGDGAPDSYDDVRMQQLLNVARGGGFQPTDLTEGEKAFVEELKADLADIESRGNAYEIPIQSTT